MLKKTDRIITLIICLRNARLLVRILLVGDLLQPCHRAPVDQLLRWRYGSSPSARLRRASASRRVGSRRYPPDSAVPPLSPTPVTSRALRHDQRLSKRMRMPGGTCAGFKGDGRATDFCRFSRLERRVNAHAAGKPGPLAPERKVTNRYG